MDVTPRSWRYPSFSVDAAQITDVVAVAVPEAADEDLIEHVPLVHAGAALGLLLRPLQHDRAVRRERNRVAALDATRQKIAGTGKVDTRDGESNRMRSGIDQDDEISPAIRDHIVGRTGLYLVEIPRRRAPVRCGPASPRTHRMSEPGMPAADSRRWAAARTGRASAGSPPLAHRRGAVGRGAARSRHMPHALPPSRRRA